MSGWLVLLLMEVYRSTGSSHSSVASSISAARRSSPVSPSSSAYTASRAPPDGDAPSEDASVAGASAASVPASGAAGSAVGAPPQAASSRAAMATATTNHRPNTIGRRGVLELTIFLLNIGTWRSVVEPDAHDNAP